MDQTQGIMRRGAVRLGLERLLAVLERRPQCAQDGSAPAAPAPGGLQTRIDPDGLVKITRGAIVLLPFQVGLRTVGKGLSVFRLDPDRLIKSPDRKVVFALPQVSDAAVVNRLCVSLVELDRLVEILDGAVIVSLCDVRIAAIVVGYRQGRRGALHRHYERCATFNPGFR